jgi:hypothetical protein
MRNRFLADFRRFKAQIYADVIFTAKGLWLVACGKAVNVMTSKILPYAFIPSSG